MCLSVCVYVRVCRVTKKVKLEDKKKHKKRKHRDEDDDDDVSE